MYKSQRGRHFVIDLEADKTEFGTDLFRISLGAAEALYRLW